MDQFQKYSELAFRWEKEISPFHRMFLDLINCSIFDYTLGSKIWLKLMFYSDHLLLIDIWIEIGHSKDILNIASRYFIHQSWAGP